MEKKTTSPTERRQNQVLFQFAFFPGYEASIEDLALNIADPEVWDFSDTKEKKYSILKNYLEYTFRKLKDERKINYTSDNSFACFNTGLITKNLEEIFVFFERSKSVRTDIEPSPFCFKGFVKKSDYRLLSKFSGNLPDIADYFQKPEDLIFNPRCEIIAQIDHIIEDNLDRFPAHMKCLDNHELRRKLEGAIDEVKRMARTNYKIAVPHFYNNRIQLLLPLNLTPGSLNPDLALATHKIDANTYTSRTCLTLKMAYNNARLIVKPQSSWLKP